MWLGIQPRKDENLTLFCSFGGYRSRRWDSWLCVSGGGWPGHWSHLLFTSWPGSKREDKSESHNPSGEQSQNLPKASHLQRLQCFPVVPPWGPILYPMSLWGHSASVPQHPTVWMQAEWNKVVTEDTHGFTGVPQSCRQHRAIGHTELSVTRRQEVECWELRGAGDV